MRFLYCFAAYVAAYSMLHTSSSRKVISIFFRFLTIFRVYLQIFAEVPISNFNENPSSENRTYLCRYTDRQANSFFQVSRLTRTSLKVLSLIDFVFLSVESNIDVLRSPCAYYCLILTKFETIRRVIFVNVPSMKF
jgi:hypothetical protein